MVIMMLELWYIFNYYIIKSAYIFNVLRWNFSKIAEMIDIVAENTHEGGCRDRLFAIEIIDLKRFCLMKFF